MPNTEDAPGQIPVATATALPVNHNTDYQFQRANDNTATPLLQPNPLHPTTTANTIVNPIQRFNTLPTNTKRITMYAFSGCCCLWMVGSAVCGWLFPGVMSFVGDIVGLFFVWKSDSEQIRMIVDAREANACHRRPPKTCVGGARAFVGLQLGLTPTC